MSEQLDSMKSTLMACAMGRMGDLENTDAKELGEVIDMIKDLEEAKYYCTITEAMEKRTKEDGVKDKIDNALIMERLRNQSEPMSYYGGPSVRYPDRRFDEYGRMYYDGPATWSGPSERMYYDGRDMRRGGGSNVEKSYTQPYSGRDIREGRSYRSRRGYMESQENHMPDAVKMQKLEDYIKELGGDLTDMVREASPEEKNTVREKLMRIAEQIV